MAAPIRAGRRLVLSQIGSVVKWNKQESVRPCIPCQPFSLQATNTGVGIGLDCTKRSGALLTGASDKNGKGAPHYRSRVKFGDGRMWMSSSENAVTITEQEPPSSEVPKRVKHRIPQKRASKLLQELLDEAKAAVPLELPDFRAGDAIEVMMLSHMGAAKPACIRGVVIRKVNKGADSSVLLRDVIMDVAVENIIPLYSPLLTSVRVLERAFIHQGKKKGKRVRQSRIYYIRNLDHKYYRVTGTV